MTNIIEMDAEHTAEPLSDERAKVWQIELTAAAGYPDRLALAAIDAVLDLNLGITPTIRAAKVFLLEGSLCEADVKYIAQQVLAEPIVHAVEYRLCGDSVAVPHASGDDHLIYVLPKPGVTDPEAESAHRLLEQLGYSIQAVRTGRRYSISDVTADSLEIIKQKVLCNDAIENMHRGQLFVDHLGVGKPYQFELVTVPLLGASPDQLAAISRDRQLSLSLAEMATIQTHFAGLGREPTDI